MADDSHMVTVGGNDQTTMVWETDFGAGAGGEAAAFGEEEDAAGD